MTKRRLDTCWGGDRRLILIDVENVVGGPCNTVGRARWARRMVDDALGVRPDDQVVAVLDEDVVRRFRHLVLVSGDGIFAGAVAALASRGVEVTVVAHRGGLSARLEGAATRTPSGCWTPTRA